MEPEQQSSEPTGPYKPSDEAGRYKPSEQAGTVIADRYKLLERIGEGGMGEVWVAEQSRPVRRKVAIKLIKAGMDSKSVLSRFEVERQALAVMDHSNIAKVFDGGHTEHGRPFFAMEYVKGVSITAYCDDARLSVAERLALFVEVCQAVQHAYQKGIIHRDLKPSNILVCLYDGTPKTKVIDFGLAKAMHQPLTEHTLYTAHGMMVGTPAYMSPEQAEFNNLDIDTRTDIYSLGVVLYELLTGTTPLDKKRFRETPWSEMLRHIKEEEPRRPSTRLSSSDTLPNIAAKRQLEPAKLSRLIRGELDWIVMKCLEKERSRRYATASALADDIQRYLRDEPVEACPPSVGYRLKKTLRRHKGPVLAASLVLLALIGGIAGMTWGFVEARQQRDKTKLALDAKEREWQRAEDSAADAMLQKAEALKQKQEAEANAIEAKRQETEALKQKHEAEQQAAIAEAVNEFLNRDLFGQDDFRNMPGLNPNLTVREVLDRASTAVENAFPEQPLVEAAVRQTLSDAYDSLGELEKSQALSERAYQMRLTHLRPDHPDTLLSKKKVAVGLALLGNRERCIELLEEVVAVASEKLGNDANDTLGYKHNLAFNYSRVGRFAESERIFQEVLAAQVAKIGPDYGETIGTRGELGGMYRLWGKYDEAERHLKEVLDWFRANVHPDHPHAHRYGMYLADTYLRSGRFDLAEQLFHQAVEALTKTAGADSKRAQLAKIGLAWVYSAQKKLDLADPLYRELIQKLREARSGVSPDVLLTEKDFAWIAYNVSEPEAAVMLLQAAAEASQQVRGVGHADTLYLIASLLEIYEATGRQDEAAKWRNELEGAK
ncbi:MAG: serine/threonine-protein kinase [Planctomycetota bacterium]|nr:serine/threonine-protein kinase [Planctomycetota bacterium]